MSRTIRAGATRNRIGGLAPGEGNRIAEAGHIDPYSGYPEGSLVTIESPGNFVLGNLIGTNASGTAPASNPAGIGIEVMSAGNVIRGTETPEAAAQRLQDGLASWYEPQQN